MKKKGLFITFEGPDGSGKTTVMKIVSKKLEFLSYKVFETKEPGAPEIKITPKIRELILFDKTINPKSEFLLFLVDRSEHVEKSIKPQLAKGKVVLCDRYIDSSVVYQGIVKGLGQKTVEELNSFAIQGAIPNITFIFKAPYKTLIARMKKDDKKRKDKFDKASESFYKKIVNGFNNLPKTTKNRNFVILDATKTPETIANEIVSKILEYRE